ncbi:MAG: tRNA (N6-threonylcarbamoyladenosine(37)-N6)-methyltransferase TrmO, partial [Armatimonadota bacterium]
FEIALEDLAGFERIWLVWWFDKNKTWRPRATPPRGPAKRRGLFATRSPHRPNPIGLTCVRLISVEGLTLTVGPLDLMDGTPVLDIKPYISTVDAFPDSGLGWVGEVEEQIASSPRYEILVSPLAARQLGWLESNWNIDFAETAFEKLRIDPMPHRTRRILQVEDRYRIACGPWRMYYRVDGLQVVVEEIQKGYSDESLMLPGHEKIIDREAQIEFAKTSFSGTV